MATLVMRQPMPRQSPTPPPQDTVFRPNKSTPNPVPIPNKHLPYCSPGPIPAYQHQGLATPPDSPPSNHASLQSSSPLQPAARFAQISKNPSTYSIDASTLDAARTQIATQLLPDPKQLFPWLHGLHPENQVQVQFFLARRKTQRQTPKCYRGITIVKVGGDLTRARLNSAIAPEEILNRREGRDAAFLEIDPKHGFSVRNFQIQATKMAVVSDIIVYRDNTASDEDMHQLARKFAIAQDTWRVKSRSVDNEDAPRFHTFVLQSSFEEIAESHPHLVAVDAEGCSSSDTIDFSLSEKREMSFMSKASEIANNVWLGPTPDSILCPEMFKDTDREFDILIETTDLATAPDAHALKRIGELSYSAPQHLEFPASGSMNLEQLSTPGPDPITKMCHWIHKLANPLINPEIDDSEEEEQEDSDGDIRMKHLSPQPRKILIHCTDGYTESTLLGLAYFMYSAQIPFHSALLRLHTEKGRNFFAYPSDVPLLTTLQTSLVHQPPSHTPTNLTRSNFLLNNNNPPPWLPRIDGSLPSRILPYMYLGNLGHANNPDLLRALGITQILSVGEPVHWSKHQLEDWGRDKMLVINDVQDNGVDSLMKDFDRCLEFIALGKQSPTATLVHCRVGVSRSATICIAEVMHTLRLSFPRAYCFVRARRLNVIIQPHLRFAYELMKWEEVCQLRRGEGVRREMEWGGVAREIGALNRPYCSR